MRKCLLSVLLLFTFFLHGKDPLKVVVISPPKCGSHLVTKCVSLMLKRPFVHGGFAFTKKKLMDTVHYCQNRDLICFIHAPFSSEIRAGYEELVSEGYKFVFILRDPRDQLVSLVYWQRKNIKYFPCLPLNELTVDEGITELMTGKRFGFVSFERFLRPYLPWKTLI